jgi:hypothetical protein
VGKHHVARFTEIDKLIEFRAKIRMALQSIHVIEHIVHGEDLGRLGENDPKVRIDKEVCWHIRSAANASTGTLRCRAKKLGANP